MFLLVFVILVIRSHRAVNSLTSVAVINNLGGRILICICFLSVILQPNLCYIMKTNSSIQVSVANQHLKNNKHSFEECLYSFWSEKTNTEKEASTVCKTGIVIFKPMSCCNNFICNAILAFLPRQLNTHSHFNTNDSHDASMVTWFMCDSNVAQGVNDTARA